MSVLAVVSMVNAVSRGGGASRRIVRSTACHRRVPRTMTKIARSTQASAVIGGIVLFGGRTWAQVLVCALVMINAIAQPVFLPA